MWPHWKRNLARACPSTRHIPLSVRRFVDYLVDAFGDDPPWDRHHTAPKQAREKS